MISGNYREVTAEDLSDAWKDPAIPALQLEVVESELETFRAGGKVAPFDTLVKILGMIPRQITKFIDATHSSGSRCTETIPCFAPPSLLEIGASSGFNLEVMVTAGLYFDYHACDYSQAFKEAAAARYPGILFDLADACDLPYPDASFDVVLSGAVLMHLEDYEKAIAEAVRVSRRYVLFHRTPILAAQPTTTFVKDGYGVPMRETHFNREHFEGMLKRNGLKLVAELAVFWDVYEGGGFGHLDFLMERELPACPVPTP